MNKISYYNIMNHYDYTGAVRRFNNITTYGYNGYMHPYGDACNTFYVNFEEQYSQTGGYGWITATTNRYNKRRILIKAHNIQWNGVYV